MFWTLTASLAASATGLAIIFIGFLRALLVPVICAGLIAGAILSYTLLKLLAGQSMPLFIFLLILALILVLALLLVFLRSFTRNQRRSLSFYEQDDCLYGADFALRDLCPLAGYQDLVLTTLTLDESADLKTIDAFNDKIMLFCARSKLILAGVILDWRNKTYKIALYAPDQKRQKLVDSFLQRNLQSAFHSEIQSDPKWDFYQNNLYPDRAVLLRMQNSEIVEELEAQGLDFSQLYPLVFTLYFIDRTQALAFTRDAVANGYDRAIYLDNQESAEAEQLTAKYANQVLAQKTTKVTREWLDIVCLEVDRLASQYGGEFDAVTLGEIDDEADDSQPDDGANPDDGAQPDDGEHPGDGR